MGFNLYFAGDGIKQANFEMMEIGGLRLLSYYLNKRIIEVWREHDHPIFLDSGAFSAHTRGAEIDVDDYIAYINERDEHLTCYAQLDTIPGEFGKPKTKQQLEEAPELTWQNYLYMVDKVKSPEKLMPIFHQGEDFKHLHRMLEHSPRVEYMGISPANDVATSRKAVWIAECFDIIKKSSNPNIKTHAFGMTSLKLLEQFPFYSADSTSWIMHAVNGSIVCDLGVINVSDMRLKDPRNIKHQPKEFIEAVEKESAKYGFTLEELSTDYKARTIFNLRYLVQWAKNYEYKGGTIVQHQLF